MTFCALQKEFRLINSASQWKGKAEQCRFNKQRSSAKGYFCQTSVNHSILYELKIFRLFVWIRWRISHFESHTERSLVIFWSWILVCSSLAPLLNGNLRGTKKYKWPKGSLEMRTGLALGEGEIRNPERCEPITDELTLLTRLQDYFSDCAAILNWMSVFYSATVHPYLLWVWTEKVFYPLSFILSLGLTHLWSNVANLCSMQWLTHVSYLFQSLAMQCLSQWR